MLNDKEWKSKFSENEYFMFPILPIICCFDKINYIFIWKYEMRKITTVYSNKKNGTEQMGLSS